MLQELAALLIQKYRRIAIVGSPGAGKSTFARRLGSLLQLPVFHIDLYYWKPGWQKHAPEKWLAIHEQLVSQSEWIIEGCALKSSFLARVAASDLVIYIRISRLRCLLRVIKRAIQSRFQIISDQPVDCSQSLPWRLVKYLWQYDSVMSQVFLVQACQQYPKTPIVIIHSQQELALLCAKLSQISY